jgi:T-complex protein 1 subunit beta
VLAAELLREAEKLVDQKIHPQTIIEGYRIASKAALTALEKIATDRSNDQGAFRKDLEAIARTTLSSKVLSQDRDQFSSSAAQPTSHTFRSSRRQEESSRTRTLTMALFWTRSSV